MSTLASSTSKAFSPIYTSWPIGFFHLVGPPPTTPHGEVENLRFQNLDQHLPPLRFQILWSCFGIAKMLKLLMLESIGWMIPQNRTCPHQPHLPQRPAFGPIYTSWPIGFFHLVGPSPLHPITLRKARRLLSVS